MNQYQIEIIDNDKYWRELVPDYDSVCLQAVSAVLDEHNLSTMCDLVELSINLSNDAEIQQLNKQYRNKNRPTNVLSFPIDVLEISQLKDIAGYTKNNGQPLMLGDIVLGLETIELEAERQQKSFYDHLSHLLVHGALHLLGYDHMTAEDADKMEQKEIEILASLGVENPYLER